MGNNNKDDTITLPLKSVNFSKDSPIIEISSKQTQTQINNVIPPITKRKQKIMR